MRACLLIWLTSVGVLAAIALIPLPSAAGFILPIVWVPVAFPQAAQLWRQRQSLAPDRSDECDLRDVEVHYWRTISQRTTVQ